MPALPSNKGLLERKIEVLKIARVEIVVPTQIGGREVKRLQINKTLVEPTGAIDVFQVTRVEALRSTTTSVTSIPEIIVTEITRTRILVGICHGRLATVGTIKDEARGHVTPTDVLIDGRRDGVADERLLIAIGIRYYIGQLARSSAVTNRATLRLLRPLAYIRAFVIVETIYVIKNIERLRVGYECTEVVDREQHVGCVTDDGTILEVTLNDRGLSSKRTEGEGAVDTIVVFVGRAVGGIGCDR